MIGQDPNRSAHGRTDANAPSRKPLLSANRRRQIEYPGWFAMSIIATKLLLQIIGAVNAGAL
jgi:hypothetical protein